MRTTEYQLFTLKDKPHDAKIISHELMLRSGMIRQLSSGLYIWLPTGLRVLKKIIKIINTEMKKIKALEILMPIIQPQYLWEKSGRLKTYGKELLKFFDRSNNSFILGPTNEEVVTYFMKNELSLKKNLPILVYQIQEKFRDEIRPRFGVIRTREFIMKDAYSFHNSQECLEKTYNILYQSYCNIFKKIEIKFYAVKAESGSMGGNISHEFQALSENGEDEVVFSKKSSYASNMNLAESLEKVNFLKNKNICPNTKYTLKTQKKLLIKNDIDISLKNYIQTILVKTNIKNKPAALLLRKDHEINIFKLEQIDFLFKPITFLEDSEIISLFGINKKFLGPLNLKIPIIADISVAKMKNFSIGANIDNQFFQNMNWYIDLPMPIIQDIRKVNKYDTSPDNTGLLNIRKSIEIGHIFQLGNKYSKNIIKEKNKKNIHMGCYGIGINRIIAATIEQNYDVHGIIWPDSIAPFNVAILPINAHKNIKIIEISEILYKLFKKNKIDVLLDDRKIRTGIMFNEIDLIGIPHQIIINQKSIKENSIEYRDRKNKNSVYVKINEIIYFIINILKK